MFIFPMPMRPMERRSFGFTSADQMCPGKNMGATPAASVVRRKERREVRGRFMVVGLVKGENLPTRGVLVKIQFPRTRLATSLASRP